MPNPILVGRFLTTWAHGRRDPPARRSSEGSAWLSAMSLIDRPEGLSAAAVARITPVTSMASWRCTRNLPCSKVRTGAPSGAIRSRPSTPTCAMDDRSSLQGTSCRLSSLVTSRRQRHRSASRHRSRSPADRPTAAGAGSPTDRMSCAHQQGSNGRPSQSTIAMRHGPSRSAVHFRDRSPG
jgi:hypothetical protein